jgi:hypothetical protein
VVEKVETPPPALSPAAAAVAATLFDDDTPFAEPVPRTDDAVSKPAVMVAEFVAVAQDDEESMEGFLEAKPADPEPVTVRNDEEDDDYEPELDDFDQSALEAAGFSALPPKRPPGATPWTIADGPKTYENAIATAETPKLKLGVKNGGPQSELSLDAAPRGRFEGENPNVFEGEDLDLPPFLRKKKP